MVAIPQPQVEATVVSTPGVAVEAFGVSGSTLAYWGYTSSYGRPLFEGDGLTLFTGALGAPAVATHVDVPTGFGQGGPPGSAGSLAIGFDASGHALVPYVAADPAGDGYQGTLNLVHDDPASGGYVASGFAGDVALPRYTAIAAGPAGQVAAYVGGGGGPPTYGLASETIVSTPGGLDRHPIPYSDYPGPMVYGPDGTLYQAIVENNTLARE